MEPAQVLPDTALRSMVLPRNTAPLHNTVRLRKQVLPDKQVPPAAAADDRRVCRIRYRTDRLP